MWTFSAQIPVSKQRIWQLNDEKMKTSRSISVVGAGVSGSVEDCWHEAEINNNEIVNILQPRATIQHFQEL